MKKYILQLFLLPLLLLPQACEKPEGIDQSLEAEILEAMEEHQVPSVVACVVKDGQIVWEEAYGYADVQQAVPATRHTLYPLMSISKLVLSTAVMQLWEEGRIDLHADINQYLPFEVRNPNYPDEVITPYLLLNHMSGLAWPLYEKDPIPDFHHFYTQEEPPLLIEWLPEYILPGGAFYRDEVWKDFAPGTKWLYSNIGASLMALIVEQISGQDYRDYCREHILEPLEMDDSGFRFVNLNEELLATPYTDSNTPMYPYTSRHYPVGWLFTHIEDFSHFMIAILNQGSYNGNTILHPTTVATMLEVQSSTSGIANLWWHCLGDCMTHNGGGTGFSTYSEWHFGHERGFFIFSNKVNGSVYAGGRIYELVKLEAQNY